MDFYEQNFDDDRIKKASKKSLWKGIFIGGGVVLLGAGFIIGCLIAILGQVGKMGVSGEFALGKETLNKMNSLIQIVEKDYLYEVDEEKMEEALYSAIFDSLGDPYSTYYTPEEYNEIMESTTGIYCGIGVVVQQDIESGYVLVVEPFEYGPAYEAGLRSGDLIVGVEGEDVKGVDLNLVVKDIKGAEGTKVNITVRRGEETFDLEVTRKMIEIINVEYELLDDGVGYISISSFEGNVAEQFKEAYNELEKDGMTSLVVDIRDNPGGLLDAVIEMLDCFIEKGELIVYTKDKDGNRTDSVAKKGVSMDMPCVVLINGNSASASEIFAGALQDYDKAYIIGTQSFGKGIVQSMMSLKDGSAFKITIEDYYTPSGKNIHGIGITPDEVVEFDAEAYNKDGTDNQLNAAIEYLTK